MIEAQLIVATLCARLRFTYAGRRPMRVRAGVTLSPRGSFISLPSKVFAEGAHWISELSVKSSGPGQVVGELSGGNQQKVQIARLLREDYDVLLIDEPTRGIDVASKAQVLSLLRDLARKGKGIVLVSSQLDELVSTWFATPRN